MRYDFYFRALKYAIIKRWFYYAYNYFFIMLIISLLYLSK